jgi:hypothetical protein
MNDDESGLYPDYEVWLEELAPHAPVGKLASSELSCYLAYWIVALVGHNQEMDCTTKRPGLRTKLSAPAWRLVSS